MNLNQTITPSPDVISQEVSGAFEFFFARVPELDHDAVMTGADDLESRDGFGIVEVAQDNEKGALAQGGFEGRESGSERGVFVVAEMAELVEPLQEDVTGKAGADGEIAMAGPDAQRQRTNELLDQARRKIYAMLASDDV